MHYVGPAGIQGCGKILSHVGDLRQSCVDIFTSKGVFFLARIIRTYRQIIRFRCRWVIVACFFFFNMPNAHVLSLDGLVYECFSV